MRLSVSVLSTLFGILGFLSNVSAQIAESSPNAFQCNLTRGNIISYESGSIKSDSIPDNFAFTLASINLENGKAQFIGNAGAADVTILEAKDGLNFIEMTAVGNLNLTTVFTSTSDDGSFLSAHSRHIAIYGDPIVSQYFGFCSGLW